MTPIHGSEEISGREHLASDFLESSWRKRCLEEISDGGQFAGNPAKLLESAGDVSDEVCTMPVLLVVTDTAAQGKGQKSK
jgi:hypothetical protein